MGGDRNLDQVNDAYTYAKKQEKEGFRWDDILPHIFSHRSLGEDYRTIPFRTDGENLLAAAVDMEETDDEFMIDGFRLRKNADSDD